MARTRMILAMILSYMIFAVLLNSVGTLILQSMQSYGVDKHATSVLDAYKDLPIALVSFLTASLLPRLGYRRAMMLALAVVACACASMPLLDTFWAVKLMLATGGVAFALVKVSVYSSIGLLSSTRQAHASLTSTIEGFFMLGVLAGPWLFGQFIDMQSDPRDPVWLRVYWVLALACVAVIALLASVRMDESAARDSHDAGESFLDMFRLLATPLVIAFLAAAFLYVLVEQGINTWLPTFNAEILRLPTVTSIQFASLFALSLAVGRLLAGLVLRRLSWHVVLSGCIVMVGALMLLVLPLAARLSPAPVTGWTDAPLVAFLLPTIGVFLAPIYPTLISSVLSALPRPRHAGMAGLIIVFSALGGAFGSFITGQLFAITGGETAFGLSLVPLALLLMAILLMRRQEARSAAMLAT